MFIRTLICFACLCALSPLFAQKTAIDSLSTCLKTAKTPQEKVQLLPLISEAYRNVNRDSSRVYAERTLAYAANGECPKCIAKAYNMLGALDWQLTRYDAALHYYGQARDLCRANGFTKGEAGVLNNMSLIYVVKGQYNKALDMLNQSLMIKEQMGDSAGMANTYLNIGTVYDTQDKNELAIAFFQKAAAMYRLLDSPVEMAKALNNLGEAYIEIKDYDTALKYSIEALQLRRSNNDRYNIASSYATIADVYQSKNSFVKAHENIDIAISQFQELGQKQDETDMIARKGTIFFKEKKYTEALTYFSRAYEMAEKIAYVSLMHDCAEDAAKAAKRLNDRIQHKHYSRLEKKLKKDAATNEE